MKRQRTKTGRFTKGNEYGKRGWLALVEKRFNGDVAAAKTWIGAIGAWAYDAPYRAMGWGSFPHPGTPEQFLERYRATLDAITLSSVDEVSF